MTTVARAIYLTLRDAARAWRANKAERLSAALAYYTLFSLAPLLLLVSAIVGSVVGARAAERGILVPFREMLGQDSARSVQQLIGGMRLLGADPVATVIGVCGLMFGASGVFHHLKDALNTIWGVAPQPRYGTRRFLTDRFYAVLMVLALGLVGMLALLVSIGLTNTGAQVAALLPGVPSVTLVRTAQLLLSFVVVLLVVALTYKLLPDASIAWSDVWVGATITALLFLASQALIALYLRLLHLGSSASLVGAVVVILVWVYCSAMIFFYGAECTWVYANRYGSRITPSPAAASLSAEERVLQGLPTHIPYAAPRPNEGDAAAPQ
jgi:membrane protein